MKKLAALALCSFFAIVSSPAQVLFQDALNYPDGSIESNGLWYAYSPASPKRDALISSNLLILNQANSDSVAAPTNGFAGPDTVYASFTINVSTLPTAKGGFFASFKNNTNVYAGEVFIATTNTTVPGTYRLGIADVSPYTASATFFPVDLAPGLTYQVVFSYQVGNEAAYLWVNPASSSDANVYGTDPVTNVLEQTIAISQIAFSQYTGQGVAAIGNIIVGQSFNDVLTNTPQIPVIGIQPQGITNYSGTAASLYVVASGLGQLNYQWLSNGVPISDGGNVSGSATSMLTLSSVQNSANYNVIIANAAGSVTSSVAVLSINSTPTPPFFTIQPQSQTNSLLSPTTLTAQAAGTGPITYQWYFQAAGTTGFNPLSGQTSTNLVFTAGYPNSGFYYLTATSTAGSQNSATVNVLVIPPPLISIAALKSYIVDANASSTINGGQIFNVEGVVTTVGDILSGGTSEFYIQDGTGACLVYRAGINSSNTPPVGALVEVISPAQSYYGAVEMDPTSTATTNGVYILSTNNVLPAPISLNMAQMTTNDPATPNTYGWTNQDLLATMTNVYLYSSTAGAAVSGTFPVNSSKTLYAFQQPYVAGAPYIPVYVGTYTNVLNQLGTNYWGKTIPSFCYQLNGINGVYSALANGLRFYPSRYADFVTTQPAAFPTSVTVTNGISTVIWPAVVGSTYSLYSATNILGPWTQTFGLGYYPSVGAYTDTNIAGAKFYKVSTP